jgi:hypothetical protein
MLCFDDSALARIFIAAGRVPAEQRGHWLQGLADRMEAERPIGHCPKKTRAEIQRDYRKRKRGA